MYDGKLMQEAVNLSKNYWLTTMDLLANMQKQNEKMWDTLMEQGTTTHQEAHRLMQDWLNGTKQAQEHYNKLMKDTWEKAEMVFGASPKTGK